MNETAICKSTTAPNGASNGAPNTPNGSQLGLSLKPKPKLRLRLRPKPRLRLRPRSRLMPKPNWDPLACSAPRLACSASFGAVVLLQIA